ncbi:MAG: hypothetical protein CL840_19785 [Crocinitomicaceae bacterium]|mgnify:FL=1|nr:hypothetical protein [Crocinitomicaceae bacterium]|tara:strand:- start:7821 stop:9257 length:1437 start_codon:yes stop_codon:yes gene_type:complete
MNTHSKTLWTVLVSNIPLNQWVELNELYQLMEKNFKSFTLDDYKPVSNSNKEPTWHRNLRNVLQQKKKKEILWDGNARYKIERPYVWRMIKDAINFLDGRATNQQIKDYISSHWDNVNNETISAQIIVLSVNHESRIHYPENEKPRKTNVNSPYDLLYKSERGSVVRYQPDLHGVWEIYAKNENQRAIRQLAEGTTDKVFTPDDIIWFKNVTNEEFGRAYLDIDSNEFVLHFPNKHKNNALSPKVNEIILIYQKINNSKSLTHLVTPVDNELITDPNRSNFKYGRKVQIIAMTNLENAIPISNTPWKKIPLSGISQGNACKLENVNSIDNLEELQFNTWQLFNGHFKFKGVDSALVNSAVINEINHADPNLVVPEGKTKLVSHVVRERNRKIIREKKKWAIEHGKLECEVCTFSFKKRFNKNFIECHHVIPIGKTGPTNTSLDDLALVCPNCHRMLHTKFEGEYLSIKQLKKIIYNSG